MTTNYERIKAMSVDEMAEFFAHHNSCKKCVIKKCKIHKSYIIPTNQCIWNLKQWLESEVQNV